MQGRFVTEEAHQVLVTEAKELNLLVVFAWVGAPLRAEDGIQWEGGVPFHDIGQLEAWGQQWVCEGSPTLGTVPSAVVFLPAPMLSDTLPAEVVLAPKADRILVNAQAD